MTNRMTWTNDELLFLKAMSDLKLFKLAANLVTELSVSSMASEKPVTLMCSCEPDEKHCHRFLFKKILESSKI